MSWEDDDTTFFEDAEVDALVRRYEAMVKHNRTDYFDEEEYEVIIDYYLLENKLGEALRVADCGNRQHPFSDDMKMCYACVLLEKGEAQQALPVLQKMNAEGISDSELFFLMGIAHMQLGNIVEALAHFDKCLQQTEDEDDLVSFLMNISSDLMDKNEFARALPYIQKALSLVPDEVEVVNEIAFCNERLGNLDESLFYYEQYVKKEPFNDNVWYNMGTVYARKGDYRQAIQAFNFAVTLNDKHASAHYNLANTFTQQANYTEAIDAFQSFLKLEPDNSMAYLTMAGCYEQLDCDEEAIKAYREAIIYDENFAEAHYGLAVAYANTGKWNSALRHIYKAVSITPDSAEYWFQLGNILLLHPEVRRRKVESKKKG